MMQKDATQLVEAARTGDAAAIHALIARYQPDVVKFARTVCATPEDAEDAVQEALWIAVQRISALRVASAFVSWLFQVVKNECLRIIRKVRREVPIERLPEQYEGAPGADPSVMAHDLAQAIANLPPHYRHVLVMRDVQGMTTPEVAATLGMSAEAVKSRLHRARAMIRATFHG